MLLDLSSYKKCIKSLSIAIAVYQKHSDERCNADLLLTIQAGVIQNFEFTYEQAWKYMKRWLEINVSSTIVDGVTRRELFRLAAEQRLIDSVEIWMRFHQARNITSHTYDAQISGEVVQVAVEFDSYAQDLLSKLEARNI